SSVVPIVVGPRPEHDRSELRDTRVWVRLRPLEATCRAIVPDLPQPMPEHLLLTGYVLLVKTPKDAHRSWADACREAGYALAKALTLPNIGATTPKSAARDRAPAVGGGGKGQCRWLDPQRHRVGDVAEVRPIPDLWRIR